MQTNKFIIKAQGGDIYTGLREKGFEIDYPYVSDYTRLPLPDITYRFTHAGYYYTIVTIDKFYLECLKCKDTSTSAIENCNNCSHSLILRGCLLTDCGECGYKNPQWKWKCNKCNCNNPLHNTIITNIEMAKQGIITEESNNSCFIATACYDDYNSQEVILLRNYRDNVLKKSLIGITFVKIYYLLSPTFASFITKSDILKKVIRKYFLDPIVSLLKNK